MPKLLWLSPLSVHDTSNPSATQMRTMLLSLKARGVEIVALSALNFLQDSGTSLFTDLEEKLKGEDTSFNLNDNDINFIYIRTKSRRLGDMPSQEQRNFYAKFCAIISAFRPDVVMGSGSDMLSMVCFDEAHRRGLPTVYTLLDSVPARFNFPNIDIVVTDSSAVSNLYASSHKINSVVTGSFTPVNIPEKLAEDKDRKRITMVNPCLEKGLGVFIRLAQLKNKELKGTKFTVLETTEGQFKEQVALLKKGNSSKPAFTEKDLSIIEVLPPSTTLDEVLNQSRMLVAPSLAFEGIVPVAREAVVRGVPVLATNQTGFGESIGDAGVLVEAPKTIMDNHAHILTDEEMAFFIKGFDMILNDKIAERCANVAARYDINYAANRLAATLKPLFDMRAGYNPQLLRNGSLI